MQKMLRKISVFTEKLISKSKEKAKRDTVCSELLQHQSSTSHDVIMAKFKS